MKVAAFVVTYRREELLRSTIEAMLAQSLVPDTILVVDNADSEATRQVVAAFDSERVVYRATGANLGSAGGTARGFEWAAETGAEYLWCGDDDNAPATNDTLERLVAMLDDAPPTVAGTGAVGTRFDWSRGETVRLRDDELPAGPIEVEFIGGNGWLLLRREVATKVGVPDPNLFFGYPDLEFCLRVGLAGYGFRIDGALLREYRASFDRLGMDRQQTPTPKRDERHVWRNYYTTRNYIFMMHHRFGRPDLARRETLKAVARSFAACTRGFSYARRFVPLQLRGIRDGYAGRQGFVVSPNSKYGAPAPS